MKKWFIASILLSMLFSCAKEHETVREVTANADVLKFETEEDLVKAIEKAKGSEINTKSETPFVSYYATVMQEDGYDDRRNAIFSDAFGSILNRNGEVIYGKTMIKIGQEGIFYGQDEDSLMIRRVSEMSDISRICVKSRCPYLKESAWNDSYALQGYDDIYVIDTFGLISDCEPSVSVESEDIPTKVYVDGEFQELTTNALELFGGTGMSADWGKNFVKPKSGDQKVKFSDKNHCNDTKMYQQHYGVDSDDGIKTKTMKKRLGTIWDKVNNPLEAGIKNISLYVQADFSKCKNDDICHVTFANREYDVYVKQARSYSSNWAIGLSNSYVTSEVSKGEQYAKEHNINAEPSAVMYVLNDEVSIVRFMDKYRYESNNSVMIIKWRTPFGGVFAAKNSRMNGDWKTAGQFHVEKLDAYACSIRGDVKKGSMMHYSKLPVRHVLRFCSD